MPIPFPNIQPSARQFVAPDWPTTDMRSQSGVVSVRLWGSKPGNGQFNLSFNNIRDEIAQLILNAHYQSKGATLELQLPEALFKGYAGPMHTWLQEQLRNDGLRWFFKKGETPSVESVVPGISSVKVTLVAELRMA